MKSLEILDLALVKMKLQKPIYQPTAFWAAASERISEELTLDGVGNFRSIPTITSYFVPKYSGPASGLTQLQAELLTEVLHENHPQSSKAHQAWQHFISGQQAALQITAFYCQGILLRNYHSCKTSTKV